MIRLILRSFNSYICRVKGTGERDVQKRCNIVENMFGSYKFNQFYDLESQSSYILLELYSRILVYLFFNFITIVCNSKINNTLI